jgi:isoleucyl-tRNA synthetase
VLFEIVMAMTKLMAPILSFTAEEIWRTLPESYYRVENVTSGLVGTGLQSSVHLASFPGADREWTDLGLAKRWERLLTCRSQVQGVLEASRRDKVIGSSLEAHVQIEADAETYQFLKPYEGDLGTIFIVSQVILRQGTAGQAALQVLVERSEFAKCERCWNYREAVGKDAAHPTLCDRCLEAIR